MFDEDEPQSNVAEFTVSELSGAIKRAIEDDFGFVRVRGELGRVARPASGHLYFDLKDDKSVLASVCWKAVSGRLAVQPEQGLEVVCTGNLTTFAGQSRYQLVVQHMEPAGAGALMALLEARRKKLAAEGLFLDEVKKPIPYLPRSIGVVTSPSGAVIRDILHRLAERFPRHVMVWPVRVQGQGSAEEVAQAIDGFNALPVQSEGDGPSRPDLIIVARGGGSFEDLWSFNEEIVVRSVAASAIPIISAIGHETDTTLIDYVADKRAPTPTAAAEMAVPVRAQLLANVLDLERRLVQSSERILVNHRNHLSGLSRGLPRPQDIVAQASQRLDIVSQKLDFGLQRFVQDAKARIAHVANRLQPRILDVSRRLPPLEDQARRLTRAIAYITENAQKQLVFIARQMDLLSHEGVLARGFALVLDGKGKPIRDANAVPEGARVRIVLAEDQGFEAQRVDAVLGSGGMGAPPKVSATGKAKKNIKADNATRKSIGDDQGDLF